MVGFGVGSFMLGFTVGKELNPVYLTATVIGLINSGDALFGAITDPLVGKLLDICSDGLTVNGVPYFTVEQYQVALVLLPLYFLGALVMLYFLRRSIQKSS